MGSGALDRQITIKRKAAVGDPEYVASDSTYGTEKPVWVTFATVWANVQDAMPSRAESVVQGLAVARNQVRVRFRYREDVTSAMTVVLNGGEVLQIVGGPAEIGGRKAFLEIQCERISS